PAQSPSPSPSPSPVSVQLHFGFLGRGNWLVLLLLAAGCSMGNSSFNVNSTDVAPQTSGDLPTDSNGNPIPTIDPNSCDHGVSYQGFGGMVLEVGRNDEDQGFDRDRVKPYSSLSGEYSRVLGTTPTLLASLGATF